MGLREELVVGMFAEQAGGANATTHAAAGRRRQQENSEAIITGPSARIKAFKMQRFKIIVHWIFLSEWFYCATVQHSSVRSWHRPRPRRCRGPRARDCRWLRRWLRRRRRRRHRRRHRVSVERRGHPPRGLA